MDTGSIVTFPPYWFKFHLGRIEINNVKLRLYLDAAAAPLLPAAAAAKRGKWTSLNGRATDSVLLHCPETKEDCDWPSEDRRCRRRRLAAARDRPSGQGRRQPSTTAGRAVRRARAGRPAGRGSQAGRRGGGRKGGGGGGRKERRDGTRTGERPLQEKADEVRETCRLNRKEIEGRERC